MATVTGTNLLDSVLAETGATMSDAAKLVTAARLQEMIDAGFDSGLEIALVLSAASSEIRDAVPVLGDLATVVNDAVAAIEDDDSGEGIPGETFTLTPGTDEGPDFEGTDDNDTYNAFLSQVQDGGGFTEFQTLNDFDVLDGGDGVDQLTAILNGAVAPLGTPQAWTTTPELIENIEQFFLTARAGAQELNMSNVAGAEQVWNDNSTQDLWINELQNGVIAGVIGGNGNNFQLSYLGNAIGADYTQTVVLDSAEIDTLTVVEGSGNITGLAFNVTGADAELTIGGDLLDITDLTIEGDAGLDVSAVTLWALETLTSTTTGDVAVEAGNYVETVSTGEGDDTLGMGGDSVESITTGAGDDDVQIKYSDLAAGAEIDLGAGDDRLDLGGNLNDDVDGTGKLVNEVSLDGGDGTDILALSSAVAANVSTDEAGFDAMFENFEKLSLGHVDPGQFEVVDLSNMNDIDYVVTSWIADGTGVPEIADVTFESLLDGQTVTIGSQSLTATSDLTAIQVAEYFDNSNVTVNGVDYTSGDNGGTATVTYTATDVGNATDLTATVTNSTPAAFDSSDVVSETQGSPAVTAEEEVAEVSVGGLFAGESTTVTDNEGGGSLTVTGAPTTEYTTVNHSYLYDLFGEGDSITIDGLTVAPSPGTDASTADVTQALLTGISVGNAIVTGAYSGAWTVTSSGTGSLTYTSNTPNTNVTDLSIVLDTTPPSSFDMTQGDAIGDLTAAEVASALAGNTEPGAVITDVGTFDYTGSASGTTVTFTANTAEAKVDLTASSTSGIQPTVSVTNQGVDGVAGVTETAEVSFEALNSGETIEVAGRTVTANGGDLTAAQVEAAYLGGVNAGNAVIGGTLTGWTVAEDAGGAGNSELEFTSTTPNTNVADIDTTFSITQAPAPTAPSIVITDGDTTSGGGTLILDEMASGGTVELTEWVGGELVVNVTDAFTSSNDELNIKLNGELNIGVWGNLAVEYVETINIETATTSTTQLPQWSSPMNLFAPDAETVTLAGNYGLHFWGSNLDSMTLLDASGVVATESSPGANDAGTVGHVAIDRGATDENVTILTGNGDDAIYAWFVGSDDPAGQDSFATIDAGAGNDEVEGSQNNDIIDLGAGNDWLWATEGEDTITLGAGNDTYVAWNDEVSTIDSRDVIVDFQANTVGQGVNGAVNEFGATHTVADRDGDVIAFDMGWWVPNSFNVDVFANAADATTFLANSAFGVDYDINVALDSSTGFTYIDLYDDGIADMVIELTGVTDIDAAAFLVI